MEFSERRSLRRSYVGYFIFFVLLLGISLYGAGQAPPNRRLYAYLLFGCFWGFWIFLSVFEWFASARRKLQVDDDRVMLGGIFGHRHIKLDDVHAAKWTVGRAGLTLRDEKRKIHIGLLPYEDGERHQLIKFFRTRLPSSVQQNWDLFCYKVALPIQYAESGQSSPPRPNEIVVTRRRWNWLVLPWTIVFALAALVHWWFLRQPGVFLSPLLVIAIWLYLSWSMPKEGFRLERMGQDRAEKRTWTFIAIWLLCGAIVLIVFSQMRGGELIGPGWGLTWSIIVFAGFFIPFARLMNARQRKERIRAATSTSEWRS